MFVTSVTQQGKINPLSSKAKAAASQNASFWEMWLSSAKSAAAPARNETPSQSLSPGLTSLIEQLKNKERDFGSLMGGGVSADKPINWDADGTSHLTSEQIDYLRSAYDITNMTKQQSYDLMADLTQMNVISAADVVSRYTAPIIPGVVHTSISSSDEGFGSMTWSGDLTENLHRYRDDLDTLMKWLLNNRSGLTASQFLAIKGYLEDETETSAKLDEIFSSIFL